MMAQRAVLAYALFDNGEEFRTGYSWGGSLESRPTFANVNTDKQIDES